MHIDTGSGVKIHKGNRAKIKGCTIQRCLNGIEVISADPRIIMNKIGKNYENAIMTVAKNGLRCDGLIKFNEIDRNKECGILVAGKENFTKIIKNQ